MIPQTISALSDLIRTLDKHRAGSRRLMCLALIGSATAVFLAVVKTGLFS